MMPMTSTTRSLDARGLTQRQRWPMRQCRHLPSSRYQPNRDHATPVLATRAGTSRKGQVALCPSRMRAALPRNAAGVLLVIAGGRSYQLGLVARGIVLIRLVLVALSSGSARLPNSSSSMRGRERLLPPRR